MADCLHENTACLNCGEQIDREPDARFLDFYLLEIPEGVTPEQVGRALEGYQIELEFDKNDNPFPGKVILSLTITDTPKPLDYEGAA